MAYSAVGGLLRYQPSNTFRQSMNSFAQKRNWSTAAIPKWAPTSDPSLDKSLHRFREKLFIPQALSLEQRNLVYKLSNAQKLKENPITVYVGPDDEPYQLRTIDRRELPSKTEAIQVIELMKKTRNWANLVPFLIGIRESGWRLSEDHLESLVAGTGSTNGLGYLLEALKQSAKTAVTIGNPEVGKRVFFELHVQAQQNNFQGLELEKTYRLAQQFAQALESPRNAARKAQYDPKKQPSVIGTLLELSAANAVNNGSVEAGVEALEYAKRFRASWKDVALTVPPKSWALYDRRLRECVPIYNGMKYALEVKEIAKDSRMVSMFQTEIEKLGVFIAEAKISARRKAVQPPTPGLLQAQALHES
ncbi:hypothetical protein BJX63DRAFT_434903 [Aspergillus granulosus]|uniref:Uncharacterized protein n=1 Tax=Aspergillus granulosus TaxID=176169 RepID=A0ABR4H2Q0_9EURO